MSVSRTTLATQGFLVGGIGYPTLAAIISILDFVRCQSPFHCAAVLGASLFYNIGDPSQLPVLPA